MHAAQQVGYFPSAAAAFTVDESEEPQKNFTSHVKLPPQFAYICTEGHDKRQRVWTLPMKQGRSDEKEPEYDEQ